MAEKFYLDKDGLDTLWEKIKRLFNDIPYLDDEWERIRMAFVEAGYDATIEQLKGHQIAVEHKVIAESGTIDNFHPGVTGDYSVLFEGNDYMLLSPAVSRNIHYSDTKSAHAMYKDCSVLVTIPKIYFTEITDMSEMFSGCKNLRSLPIIEMANAENLSKMFNECVNMQQFGTFVGTSATDASDMFKGCKNLLSIDYLALPSAKTVSGLFDGCEELYEFKNVTVNDNCSNYSKMFKDCKSLTNNSLNNVNLKFIKQYDSSLVLDNMFDGCEGITSTYILRDALLAKSTVPVSAKQMYKGTSITKLEDLNITTGCPGINLEEAFSDCDEIDTLSGNISIVVTDGTTVNLSGAFKDCNNLSRLSGSYKIIEDDIDASISINGDDLFSGCTSLYRRNNGGTCEIHFTSANRMFKNCVSISDEIVGAFKKNSLFELESANSMFENCVDITRIPDSSFDNLKYANSMFKGCAALESLTVVCGKLIDASSMFEGAFTTSNDDVTTVTFSGTYNVTNMNSMFKDSSIIKIEDLDCSVVTDVTDIFTNCYSLEHISGGLHGLSISIDLSQTSVLDPDDWREIASSIASVTAGTTMTVSQDIYDMISTTLFEDGPSVVSDVTIKQYIEAKGWTVTV